MSIQETIRKYLTIDQNHVKEISKGSPLRSKDEFNQILKVWSMVNSESTASVGSSSYSQKPWIWIEIGSSLYHLNSDTKLFGVNEYLEYKNSDWSLIENDKGVVNKIVNSPNRKPIEGFYLYKLL